MGLTHELKTVLNVKKTRPWTLGQNRYTTSCKVCKNSFWNLEILFWLTCTGTCKTCCICHTIDTYTLRCLKKVKTTSFSRKWFRGKGKMHDEREREKNISWNSHFIQSTKELHGLAICHTLHCYAGGILWNMCFGHLICSCGIIMVTQRN